jgi:hypothetical protein
MDSVMVDSLCAAIEILNDMTITKGESSNCDIIICEHLRRRCKEKRNNKT